MLVLKEIGKMENKRITIGETVTVMDTHQIGKVVGYENGMWLIKTTDGNTIPVGESRLEIRQVLFG